MATLEELKTRQAQLEQALNQTTDETLTIGGELAEAASHARRCRANVAIDPSAGNKKLATAAANKLESLSQRESELYEVRTSLEGELEQIGQELREATAADLVEKRKRIGAVVQQEIAEMDDQLHRIYARRVCLLAMSIGFHPGGIDPISNAAKVISKKKLGTLYPEIQEDIRQKHSLQGVI